MDITTTTGAGETTTETATSSSATIPPPPIFDLETYINRYHTSSETRLQRLLFIAEQATCSSSSTATDNNNNNISNLAYELLEKQLKDTGNFKRYKEIFGDSTFSQSCTSTSSNSNNMPVKYDVRWINDVESKYNTQLETLEGRLNASQSHLNKESIRIACLSLSEFYMLHSEFTLSLKFALRSRDYCTTRNQMMNLCLLIIEMAINIGNYAQVRDYVVKAEHQIAATSMGSNANASRQQSSSLSPASSRQQQQHDTYFPLKLRIASGLAYLDEGKYYDAAIQFNSVQTSLLGDGEFNTVIATEDVALYGSLLALATFTRTDLKVMLEPPPTGTNSSETTGTGTGTAAGGNNTSNATNAVAAAGGTATTVSDDGTTSDTGSSGGGPTNTGSHHQQQQSSLSIDFLSRIASNLELVPRVRDAIRHYVRAEYKSCLSILYDELLPSLLQYDLYLYPHLHQILDLIRNKCFIEYLKPFKRVELSQMCTDFNYTSIDDIRQILVTLIGQGQICNTQINCRTNTLERTLDTDELILKEKQRQLKRNVLQLQDKVLNEIYSMMVRLSCIDNDLIVSSSGSGGGSSKGRRRGRGFGSGGNNRGFYRNSYFAAARGGGGGGADSGGGGSMDYNNMMMHGGGDTAAGAYVGDGDTGSNDGDDNNMLYDGEDNSSGDDDDDDMMMMQQYHHLNQQQQHLHRQQQATFHRSVSGGDDVMDHVDDDGSGEGHFMVDNDMINPEDTF